MFLSDCTLSVSDFRVLKEKVDALPRRVTREKLDEKDYEVLRDLQAWTASQVCALQNSGSIGSGSNILVQTSNCGMLWNTGPKGETGLPGYGLQGPMGPKGKTI
jgi:hypothetical protein